MIELLDPVTLYRLNSSKIEAKHLKDFSSFHSYYNTAIHSTCVTLPTISDLKLIVDDLLDCEFVIIDDYETVVGLPRIKKNDNYKPDIYLDFQSKVAKKYIKTRVGAIRRGKEFTLKLSDIERLMKRKVCYYSGVKFTENGDNALTFDRIDNSKGYTKENTVACAASVNFLKNYLIEQKVRTENLSKTELKKTLLSFANLL